MDLNTCNKIKTIRQKCLQTKKDRLRSLLTLNQSILCVLVIVMNLFGNILRSGTNARTNCWLFDVCGACAWINCLSLGLRFIDIIQGTYRYYNLIPLKMCIIILFIFDLNTLIGFFVFIAFDKIVILRNWITDTKSKLIRNEEWVEKLMSICLGICRR